MLGLRRLLHASQGHAEVQHSAVLRFTIASPCRLCENSAGDSFSLVTTIDSGKVYHHKSELMMPNPRADLLLVTVTKVESKAVLQACEQAAGHKAQPAHIDDRIYFD